MGEDGTELHITRSSQKDLTPRAKEVLSQERDKYIEDMEKRGLRLRILNESDSAVLSNYRNLIKNKLTNLGLQDLSERVPSDQTLVILDDPDGPFASVDNFHSFVTIHLPPETDLRDKKVRDIYIHETSHFLADAVYHVGEISDPKKRYKGLVLGIGNYVSIKGTGFSKPHSIVEIGAYEEGLADIFTAYCTEEETETPYLYEAGFFIALCSNLAQKDGVDEVTAFEQFFKAKTSRDFSFMKRLTEHYGKDFVRKLNTAKYGAWIPNEISSMQFEETAALGGFLDLYKSNLSTLESGQTLSLNGMMGKIKLTEE